MESNRYEEFFYEANVSGSGFLTLEEFTDVLRKKGYKESDSKIKNMLENLFLDEHFLVYLIADEASTASAAISMFRAIDISGDNQISLEEYNEAMGLIPPQNHKDVFFVVFREATLRSLFRSFDLNGDGRIDKSELQKVFISMGRVLTPYEADRMMKLADQDQNESLDYEEFIKQVFNV